MNTRTSEDDAAERLFVGLMWLGATVATAYFVAAYARNVPYYEDYMLVPVLTGRRPFSLSWLLELTVLEHRMPFAKALLYPIWLVSDGDFRSAMFVDLAALSGLSYACMRVARSVRGHVAFVDALFPVLFLSWGHAETLLFFVQVVYVAPVVIVTAIVLLVAANRWEGRPWVAAALGTCVLLLPLNSGIGMTLAPPLVAWTAYAAFRRWRSGEPGGRREGAILAGAAATSTLLAALYMVGIGAAARMAGSEVRSARTVARTVIEVLSLALGPAGRGVWPWLGLAVAALGVAAVCVLALVIASLPEERLRASGLLACLAGLGLMVAAIGFGRAQVGAGAGFVERYALLVAPAVVCLFLTAVLYGGYLAGRFAQILLFTAALTLVGPSLQVGLEYAKYRAGLGDALAADVRDRVPLHVLGQRYTPRLFDQPTVLAERLAMLHDAGLGPFKGVPATPGDDAPVREVPLPLTIVGSSQVEVEGNVVRGIGPDPYVVLALPEPAFVVGVRMTFTVTNEAGAPAHMQAYWRRSGHNDFEEGRRTSVFEAPTGPGEQTQTVWIYDTIDGLRIDPDKRPCEMRISELVLYVRE